MLKDNCIFCKIISGEFDSAVVWEDDNFLAFLDINPNTEGMTLVVPKDHYDSDFTAVDDKVLCELQVAAKKVATALKKSLHVERVAQVIEGLGVNHIHIKLYPLYDLSEGYITTELGENREMGELKDLADKIRQA